MYVPSHFEADEALAARLSVRFAGIVITVDPEGAPVATHAPLLWDAGAKTASGHIARANPQWRFPSTRALVVLAGPEAYVSPSWCPSKAEHGKVVPTWNYEAVHLSGSITWFDDAERLRALVSDLSAVHENARENPWRIEDAPRPYIDAMLRGIVGFSMRAEAIESKRKLSQNKSAADFAGVAEGLAGTCVPASIEIAGLMRTLKS